MSPLERRDDKLQELQIPGGQSGAPPAGDDPEEAVDELVDDVVSGEATEEEEEELEELYEEVGEGDQSTSETQALAVELESELDEEDAMRRLIRRRGDGSPKKPGPFRRLYRGETSFDFVGRRRTWFLISGTIIVLGMLSLGIRGLNLGIDFKGGTSWEVTAPGVSQTAAVNAVEAAGVSNPVVTILAGKTIEVQADLNNLAPAEQKTTEQNVVNALAKLAHVDQNVVSQSTVGPTWGSQVTQRALLGLVVFLIVVAIYISFRFEPKMALAAFVALMHDLLVTVGIYSIAGFQVTPDTVIAILTILGYSLYDTVVVFDRVRDNTKGFGSTGRMTYSEMVNLSMNQT
ncbi:MAG TPA: protein translocase subunit SecF, partial [Acidimicrobiales bacterium]|nr:protein translocase subunit SecF [Acidimicrobiales bacterium]